ncbi:uncharacterized protein MCYG_02099 [Microsporum canis CBS 113480]|uniref:Uncharacterized protein n=1 Tax=Arthroderma otae (strain ATCC MYA-4605 / CBS 113480) TaxID=554155 RepID=C5FIL1_ARTOC|nr:uncharacterized protein MCYG_02099 [Microsporum canis CBS 113480]EEQ29280.1 predicted protein [Microsporum canis CBS 113480]
MCFIILRNKKSSNKTRGSDRSSILFNVHLTGGRITTRPRRGRWKDRRPRDRRRWRVPQGRTRGIAADQGGPRGPGNVTYTDEPTREAGRTGGGDGQRATERVTR